MTKYRSALPQLSDSIFITDGGLETTLVFQDCLELPCFAAFDLLKRPGGRDHLQRYFERYIALAKRYGVGIVLESATWRANADWGLRLGYTKAALADANRQAIALLAELRATQETGGSPMVISGCIGPRGDGYKPAELMSPEEAERYHAEQIETFRDTDADMVCAITMTNSNEAIGVVRAARKAGMPVAVSFTVETDSRLPTGQSLEEAIQSVDAATADTPVYYMINCAHPTHFQDALTTDAPWANRIYGIRANASTCSHAELDESEVLDDGDPQELGSLFRQLRAKLARLHVLGGCCGTDHRHIEQICNACI